jgi:hypothetical protein
VSPLARCNNAGVTLTFEADHRQDGEGDGRTPDAVQRSKRRPYDAPASTRTLRTTVAVLGPRVLDRRATLGKALATWKAVEGIPEA